MRELKAIERRGKEAVERIRKEALLSGESFLLYDDALPEGYYYMEYPDGDIKIVSVSQKHNDFIIREELDSAEVNALRRRLKLSPVLFTD